MKITRIEAIPLRIPLEKGMSTKTAHGEHVVTETRQTLLSHLVLRRRDDAGAGATCGSYLEY
jgi:hypothetical protein